MKYLKNVCGLEALLCLRTCWFPFKKDAASRRYEGERERGGGEWGSLEISVCKVLLSKQSTIPSDPMETGSVGVAVEKEERVRHLSFFPFTDHQIDLWRSQPTG